MVRLGLSLLSPGGCEAVLASSVPCFDCKLQGLFDCCLTVV